MPATTKLLMFLALTISLASPTGFALQQSKKSDPAKSQSSATEILTNDSILQLLSVGIDEDVIISKIQNSRHNFDLSVQGMLALKKGGVSDRLMHFMMDPTKLPASKAEASPAGLGETVAKPAASKESARTIGTPAAVADESGFPTEIGVYVKTGEQWMEVQPEIVNWQTGGVLKRIATVGVVKGDVNGRVNGAHSRNAVRTPLEFLIVTAEGVAITEYQLIHLREQRDRREFRTVTGGVFHSSGGATRDLLQFEGQKVLNRTFLVKLPTLGAGEYGFLQASASTSGSSANLGKMFTFRVGE